MCARLHGWPLPSCDNLRHRSGPSTPRSRESLLSMFEMLCYLKTSHIIFLVYWRSGLNPSYFRCAAKAALLRTDQCSETFSAEGHDLVRCVKSR